MYEWTAGAKTLTGPRTGMLPPTSCRISQILSVLYLQQPRREGRGVGPKGRVKTKGGISDQTGLRRV